MSVYAYCDKCGTGLGRPTLSEAAYESRECPNCERETSVRDDELPLQLQEMADLVATLVLRIDALEKGVPMSSLTDRLENQDLPTADIFKEAFVALHGPKPCRGSRALTDWLNIYDPFSRQVMNENWLSAAMLLASDNAPDVLRAAVDMLAKSCWKNRERSRSYYKDALPRYICIAAIVAQEQ